jgi:hypothetical protein
VGIKLQSISCGLKTTASKSHIMAPAVIGNFWFFGDGSVMMYGDGTEIEFYG